MKLLRSSIFIVFLLSFSTLSAQHRGKNSNRQFDLEMRAGANFCQIDGDESGNFNKIGFHASVGTSFPLSDDDRWRFVVELGLTQKGSRIDNNNIDRHISLTYVEVPLMVAYDFMERQQLRIAAGVAPAILAKSNVTTDGSHDQLQSDNYKRLDLLPLCISLRYRFTDTFGFDIRLYNSLLNIANENGTGTYRIFRSNKGQFNRLVQAGITIDF
jgi:hypothetical protein